jgi:hypothetical protein
MELLNPEANQKAGEFFKKAIPESRRAQQAPKQKGGACDRRLQRVGRRRNGRSLTYVKLSLIATARDVHLYVAWAYRSVGQQGAGVFFP